MYTADIDQLRDTVLRRAGQTARKRDVLHDWALSHVERLDTPSATVIFKCAVQPFLDEARSLSRLRAAEIDVPEVITSVRTPTALGMVLEDMGAPEREATDADAVAAIVPLHAAPVPDHLPIGSAEWLATLPGRAVGHLARLRAAGRWNETSDIADALEALDEASLPRARGVRTPPFGWVHSEFHPESLHVRGDRRRLYDLARAFAGPGLIDLASWHGTVDVPDPARTRDIIDAYVAAGGPGQARAIRGGLPAENWALGWHRVWVVEWFLAQAAVWIADHSTDHVYVRVVRRHVQDAVHLLKV
ncbi:aminoglycoside phosphotransferase family protein [Marinitenerispora sediminis]|uniref:Aminoglycoside phosphotransferase n=1 Tax=Marinitenerispora sediminis TaxID=1931232 RepID=A0A368TCB2_9ACTN|nr:phosphotransferase [Marinitenerispora sediminis]RCV56660.1 aminoglycoside phosphotransferase [Marinitenerispora sediminis]RCV61652.1 aminoglycoside phosphotransferase [Marinitenerispora sediminis]RCV62616.1 aminoglycoside phosphotransferase [Marinitenerispora sediminis]